MADATAPIPGEEIVTMSRSLGFALAGVCRASPSDYEPELRDWLARGEHGSMGYIAHHLELRLDPAKLAPGAKSIIMVADQYAERGAPGEDPIPGAYRGRIARYAQGRDYHINMKKRLHRLCDALLETHPGETFRAFVDTAPVLEREHAARAGLGWIGKHTLLINPRIGSWFFLGGILTTLDIAPPGEQRVMADHCGACTRCIDACPTSAITEYSVNASRCIAYLTIERRETIATEFHTPIGDWIFGCDICQEVCPHNSPRPDARDIGAANASYTSIRTGFDLLDVLGWTERDRGCEFQSSALKRATLDMMKRNAIIALMNEVDASGDPAVPAAWQRLADDETESPLVRSAARGALNRSPIGGNPPPPTS